MEKGGHSNFNKTPAPIHRNRGLIVLGDLLMEDDDTAQENRDGRLNMKQLIRLKQPLQKPTRKLDGISKSLSTKAYTL